MARARSALELDLDPDVTIGLGLPMEHDEVDGFFPGTSTTLSQTGSNIRNLLLTNRGERVGQPTFGADLLLTLFEPMSDELIIRVEENPKINKVFFNGIKRFKEEDIYEFFNKDEYFKFYNSNVIDQFINEFKTIYYS